MSLLLLSGDDVTPTPTPVVVPSDNYKAKMMRRQLPPPFKKDFGAVVPAILTVIGQSDNLIGGLFGADDFLPDEDG